MLADMQAVMSGSRHAPSELDIEDFRLLVRQAILSLTPVENGAADTVPPSLRWAEPGMKELLLEEAAGLIQAYDYHHPDATKGFENFSLLQSGWWL